MALAADPSSSPTGQAIGGDESNRTDTGKKIMQSGVASGGSSSLDFVAAVATCPQMLPAMDIPHLIGNLGSLIEKCASSSRRLKSIFL